MKNPAFPMAGWALLGVALLAGCTLSRPYPAKQLYVLDAGAPPPSGSAPTGGTLRVARVRVVEPFSRASFHYLVAPSRFEADYYSTFAAEPDRLITGELIEWLSATGLYDGVVDAASTADASHTLHCVISELYCDKTDPTAPRAVISARFILLDEAPIPALVVSTRDYHAIEPLQGSDSDALAQGFGAALQRILTQLTTDLAAEG